MVPLTIVLPLAELMAFLNPVHVGGKLCVYLFEIKYLFLRAVIRVAGYN